MTWTPERKDTARKEARRWLGTPHRNHMAIPGVGIDCIRFVVEVLKGAGLLPGSLVLPSYNPLEGLHTPSTRIQALMRSQAFLPLLELEGVPDVPEFGDVLVFRNGDVSGHVGIIIDGQVWHALGGRAVTCSQWNLWRHRVATVFRITEL